MCPFPDAGGGGRGILEDQPRRRLTPAATIIPPRSNMLPTTKIWSGFWRQCTLSLLALSLLPQCAVCAQTEQRTETVRDQFEAKSTNDSKNSVETSNRRGLERYEESIKPLLQQACFDCHSGESIEGNFRADQLNPDLVGGPDTAWWLEVYSVLSTDEMPPPDSSQLSDADRSRIVDWLSTEIQTAEKARKVSGNRSSFRRLTRYEYNYALQDLLGVSWAFADDLPSEASEDDGFENNAASLRMSVKQVETYHQLALRALRRVTIDGDRPPMLHWGIPIKAAFDREKNRIGRSIESTKKKLEDEPAEQVEELTQELEQLRRQLTAPEDRSHYVDLQTGDRVEIDWNYRKAIYAFAPSDAPEPMPVVGQHFAVVQPGSRQSLTVELGDRVPNEGPMLVRIRASRAKDAGERIPSLQLYFGFQATDQGRAIKRVSKQDIQITAPYGAPEIYQWQFPLGEIEHRNTYRGEMKLGQQPNPTEYIRFSNSTVDADRSASASAAVLINYVEVAAPVYASWPPAYHRNLLIESDKTRGENARARQIITTLITRAWRRTSASDDVQRKLDLFERLRPGSKDFQEAILEVLATILTSPKFLYVLPGDSHPAQNQAPTQLSTNELATRLSLFLWCSLPDEELLELAATDRLEDPEILAQQVERMLHDQRAERFTKHFVSQWLKMQPLEFLQPTRGDDGLDEALLESMKQEPVALFADMLRHDSSILDFIDADYLVVNERLASHYGIAGVQGNHFRRVQLPSGLHRGGMLTQAGLLTMNSDGEDSHPVKRGVWLLTSFLNDPPPPPPPAVPEIDLSDPEIAKLTLKERIEDHRDHAACLSCHQKIDPWGIAFENYDALGRWREKIDGKEIDASSVLPGESHLDGIVGLKQYLRQRRDEQFVRATVEKMAAFALGRQLDFGDRAHITDITQRVRQAGDGLRAMVTSLVTSELFRAK